MRSEDEIIIDGVNVAGCIHFWNINEAKNLKLCKINFDNVYFSNGLPLAEKCKEHKNCYYKQLKRLEQENAELKQENEELRNLWRLDCLKCENTKSNVDNYRTALEEIREMLITCCDRDYCEGCEYYDKCFNGTSVPDIDLVMINKINEVLKDE